MRARIVLLSVIAVLSLGVWGAVPGTAQIPTSSPPLRVKVTGDPAPVETLQLAIVSAARTVLPGAAGAQISLRTATPPLDPLPAASETTLQAEFGVTAPGGAPVTYWVPVTVTNEVLPWSDAQALIVSNSPETFAFSKVLYSGAIGPSETARLLYHHQNGSAKQTMAITVTLSNPAREPILVWVTGASMGPGGDELAVGHEAARRFLDQYWHRAGFLLRIPANTTLPLFVHRAPPGGIVSGLVQLSLVEGARANIVVAGRLAGEAEPPPMSFLPTSDTIHQRGVFGRPQITRDLEYMIGASPSIMMTIGGEADLVRDGQSGQTLQGNYGVLYTYQIKVTNPTPEATALALVMHAVGGQARGTFLLGDQVIDGPVVFPNAPQRLATVHIGPLDRKTLVLSTISESGSNYPVQLTLAPQWVR